MPVDAGLWNWVHLANIERYRRIMATPLTPIERRFVERRIQEEEAALRRGSASLREAPGDRERGADSR